jgi:hypothetical protein
VKTLRRALGPGGRVWPVFDFVRAAIGVGATVEYVRYYHECRPHLGLGNLPPAASGPPPEADSLSVEELICHERLGGLLKHHEQRAA